MIDAMGNDRDSMAAMKEKLAPNDTEINFSWGGNAFLNSLLRKCPGLSNQFAFTFIIQGSTVRYAWNGPYSKDVYNGVLDSLIPGILGDDDSMNLYHFGITGACDYTKASEVLELLNDHREKNGLTPLTMDAELTEAAMQRAAEIAIYTP